MKRVAAIYDIHGNLPALEAVLAQVQRAGVDQIVIGGDVLPGPMPLETLARLRALAIPAQFILGNGDAAVLAQRRGTSAAGVPEPARAGRDWVAAQLLPEHEHWIAGWPLTARLEIDGLGATLFCHATPRNNTEVFTRLTAEAKLLPVFAGAGAALVVCGHTHMQFDRRVGNVRVVNAGSTGMPYGEPGARWLLLGPEVAFQRTPYDFAAAAEQVRRTQYPAAEDFAANNILKQPDEAEALEVFTRAELK